MTDHLHDAALALERAAQAPTRARLLALATEALEALGDAPEVPNLLKDFVLKPQVRRLRANPTFPALADSFWADLPQSAAALRSSFYRARRHYEDLEGAERLYPSERPARPSERQEDCPICCAPLQGTRVKTLACRHVFHSRCIDTWASYSYDTCPMCRRVVRISEAFPPPTGGRHAGTRT